MLQFVHTTAWRVLFGRPADGLEKSTERADEYFISDKDPITNLFISVPKELGALILTPGFFLRRLVCVLFLAGLSRGRLCPAGD